MEGNAGHKQRQAWANTVNRPTAPRVALEENGLTASIRQSLRQVHLPWVCQLRIKFTKAQNFLIMFMN